MKQISDFNINMTYNYQLHVYMRQTSIILSNPFLYLHTWVTLSSVGNASQVALSWGRECSWCFEKQTISHCNILSA